MVESDLDFALGLANREGWDYDLADLRRLRRIFPAGCFLAEYGGAKAGWVAVSTYGNLAWIGSLVVQDDLRGKGIGAALVDHAVRYTRELGVKTVGLYSYRNSVGFYERMGFKHDCDFDRIQGMGRKISSKIITRCPSDLGELMEFDRRYFRADRRLLVEALHEDFPDLFGCEKETDVVGYIAAKSFADGTAEIGPWVCDHRRVDVAEKLFTSELSQLPSRTITLTIPSENMETQRLASRYGFRIKQRVARMSIGSVEDLPVVGAIYAAAGLDVG